MTATRLPIYEKPQIGESWINGGFLVFEPEIFRYLEDDNTSLEAHALERLAAERHALVKPKEVVLVILDSNHGKQHVLNEPSAYHDLVTSGSYIVATDGSMKDLHDVPRGKRGWICDNPHCCCR